MTKAEIIAYLLVHADAKEKISIVVPDGAFADDAATLRKAAEMLKAVPEWICARDAAGGCRKD